MQRIIVVGCPGAGKTRFSMELHKITGLPLIHLDQVFWKAGWVESELQAFRKEVEKLTMQEQWIIDGNYGSTMDIRLKRADTVVVLDRSRWVCLFRAFKRSLLGLGSVRADMAPGCPEHFNWEFFEFVYQFPEKHRPRLLNHLKKVTDEQRLFWVKNEQESRATLTDQ